MEAGMHEIAIDIRRVGGTGPTVTPWDDMDNIDLSLTPVPEPSSTLVTALGFATLAIGVVADVRVVLGEIETLFLENLYFRVAAGTPGSRQSPVNQREFRNRRSDRGGPPLTPLTAQPALALTWFNSI